MNDEIEISEKQAEYIRKANHRWNGKVGATQCGKTYIDTLYIIPDRIIERIGKKGLNFIVGVSKETITRNIIEPLQEIFGNKVITDISSKNTSTMFGEKVYCLGADNVGRVAKFRGARAKYIYIDEIYDINKEVFELLKSRLSFEYSICDFAGNPQHPNHFVEEFIKSGADIYVQRYTIFDNPFLPKTYVDNLCREYEGTIYYSRYILGQPCFAEGLIYRQFADNPSIFIKDEAVDEFGHKKNFMIISVGIDYGANKSTTRFICNGITSYFKEVWALDEMKIEGVHDPEYLYEKFVEFYERVYSNYGKVTHGYGDYGSLGQVLTYGINKHLQIKGIPLQINDCIKGRILDRIELDCHLFASKKRFILKKCNGLIEAYSQALWDSKCDDERLDDGTTDIDSLDANEYSYFPFYDKLMLDIKGN